MTNWERFASFFFFLLYIFARSMNSHCQCFKKNLVKKNLHKNPPVSFFLSLFSLLYFSYFYGKVNSLHSLSIIDHLKKIRSFPSSPSLFFFYIFLQRKMNSHSSRSFREISTEAIEARFHPFPLSLISSPPFFSLSFFFSFFFFYIFAERRILAGRSKR